MRTSVYPARQDHWVYSLKADMNQLKEKGSVASYLSEDCVLKLIPRLVKEREEYLSVLTNKKVIYTGVLWEIAR